MLKLFWYAFRSGDITDRQLWRTALINPYFLVLQLRIVKLAEKNDLFIADIYYASKWSVEMLEPGSPRKNVQTSGKSP